MSEKRLILDSYELKVAVKRLCYEIIENHRDFSKSVLLGLQPRGSYFAEKIKNVLESDFDIAPAFGLLDITFHRDDFRRKEFDFTPGPTLIPDTLENKKVILVDDVLYSGRTVRAALDAMLSYGRPALVELCVLIDRKYTRELPIEPKYVGRHVNTLASEKVLVELSESGHAQDHVWLVPRTELNPYNVKQP